MRCLITNISQMLSAASINVSNTIESWSPYIEEAQQSFILPVLGTGLYDQLLSVIELLANPVPSSPADPKLTELLERIQKPLALYALWLGADEFGVCVSAQGIQVIETNTHKTAPQYRVQNLKENWIRRANTSLDLALKFIEDHRSDYPLYNPTDADLFIRTTEEFNSEVDIHESRRVFVSLKPIIRSIENKYIRPTLSPALFDELKSAWLRKEITEDHQKLVAFIHPALAHLTMARALVEISIDVLDWGIFDSASSTFSNVSSKRTSNKKRIALMHQASLADGEAELKALQEFLDQNASETFYPAYFHSSRYAGKENAGTRNEFINKSTNSIFVA